MASHLCSLGYRFDILSKNRESGRLVTRVFVDPDSEISSLGRQKDLLKTQETHQRTSRVNNLISKLWSLIFCDTGWRWSIAVGKLLFSKAYRYKYKLIIVTGRPFIAFLTVYVYAVFYGKKYILDYRDSWLKNPATAWYSRFFRPLLRILERLVIKRASGVFSASLSISKSLGFNDHENVLYNYPCLAYSQRLQQLYAWQPQLKGKRDIVLAYTGSVFKVNSLAPICKAIASLDKSSALNLEFHYYGPSSLLVRKEFVRHKIIHLLHDHGPVPKDIALKALSHADAAVCTTYSLLRKPTEMELGLVTTKIFDYILIGIPTIVVSPNGSELRSILREFKGPRLRVFTPCEDIAIADTIRYLAKENRESIAESCSTHMQKVLATMSTKSSLNAYKLERLVEAGF